DLGICWLGKGWVRRVHFSVIKTDSQQRTKPIGASHNRHTPRAHGATKACFHSLFMKMAETVPHNPANPGF
ncbi:hypothetical protein OLG03_10680, partial [Streptococcus pneumoniae]|nr:hypothetical protein [Streptococcus pneumoniae]